MKTVDPINLTGTYTLYSPVFPNPFICAREMVGQFSYEILNRSPYNGIGPWLRENWEWHYTSFYFDMTQVYQILGIAVFLTLLRLFLNFALLKRIPKWFNIIEHDAEKFPESSFKMLIHGVTWFWAMYLCVFSEDKFFFYPSITWQKFVTGVPVPSELYWLYMLQMGFYVHCVYASAFLETIRRDFTVLMLHHFLTLGLLSYSFGVRYHYLGLLLLFIQDIGDLTLEVTKSILYFKIRNGIKHKVPETLANITFAFFTLQWIVFRLYWFMTKVVYSSSYVSVQMIPNGPFYLSFNIMLLALYAMQVYWFIFIVKLLVKVLSGEDVKDNRETDEDEAARQLSVEKAKAATSKKYQTIRVIMLSPEAIAARDSVLYTPVGVGACRNTTYGTYSPFFPDPITCLSETIPSVVTHFSENFPRNGLGPWLQQTWEWHYSCSYVSNTDLLNVVLIAVLFTVVRHILNEVLLKRIPEWFNICATDAEKFPEAAFRTGVYTVLWIWAVWIVAREDLFTNLLNTVINWTAGSPIIPAVYWLYMFEMGLYLHSLYATIFVEVIRRDFAIQIIHHILTLSLLGYSHMIRVHNVGLLVLFMHDIGDVTLELSKTILYFKTRNGVDHKLPEVLANCSFVIFVLEWILFRIYWIPTKVLYTTGHVSKMFYYPVPFYMSLNMMLWGLYVIHWYWFIFIIKLVVKLAMGINVADNRDYDYDEKDKDKKE